MALTRRRSLLSRFANAWDDYAERFGRGGLLGDEWGGEVRRRRLFALGLEPLLANAREVVELGPGGGRFSMLVAPHVERLVLADVSRRMLERSQSALRGSPVAIEPVLLQTLDLRSVEARYGPRRFDLVFGMDVFLHFDLGTTLAYLQSGARLLRPGGALLYHGLNIEAARGRRQFREQFGRGLWFQSRREAAGLLHPISFAAVRSLMAEAGLEARLLYDHPDDGELLVLGRVSES